MCANVAGCAIQICAPPIFSAVARRSPPLHAANYRRRVFSSISTTQDMIGANINSAPLHKHPMATHRCARVTAVREGDPTISIAIASTMKSFVAALFSHAISVLGVFFALFDGFVGLFIAVFYSLAFVLFLLFSRFYSLSLPSFIHFLPVLKNHFFFIGRFSLLFRFIFRLFCCLNLHLLCWSRFDIVFAFIFSWFSDVFFLFDRFDIHFSANF